ncbi:Thiol-disulfide oxidoreductase D [Rickettsiales bacterium Ac37b]|nr:Thiol-disulfide oxidoreductase D [Rickettsiales bacterium Ac37b]
MARSNKSILSPVILVAVILVVGLYIFYKSPVKTDTLSIGSIGKSTKEELASVVKEILQENPEMIISSLEGYQQKKMKEMEAQFKETMQSKKGELQNSSTSPYIGNASGDITIVEFFDYNCKYCKSVNKVLEQLLESDKNVKIVFKELPVLGPKSQAVAEAALAVHFIDPNKFLEFHNALMYNDNDDQSIRQLAQNMSIDTAKLEETMKSTAVADELNKVRELAAKIGIRGTPAFVIEDELIPGAIDLNVLKQKIADIRAKKAQK